LASGRAECCFLGTAIRQAPPAAAIAKARKYIPTGRYGGFDWIYTQPRTEPVALQKIQQLLSQPPTARYSGRNRLLHRLDKR
jgi:hypothetical protein